MVTRQQTSGRIIGQELNDCGLGVVVTKLGPRYATLGGRSKIVFVDSFADPISWNLAEILRGSKQRDISSSSSFFLDQAVDSLGQNSSS